MPAKTIMREGCTAVALAGSSGGGAVLAICNLLRGGRCERFKFVGGFLIAVLVLCTL